MIHHTGHLIWRGFQGTELPGWLADLIAAGRCGGIVVFGRNVADPRQVWGMARSAAAAFPERAGRFPVAIDQEGGRVARLREPDFTAFPPARTIGVLGDERLARDAGRAVGEELAAVGINVDFAPVVDVQGSPGGVVGDRSFGGSPDAVARMALAWLEGLESSGVRGCVKHFPGHGDASCDSHLDLPTADGDASRLAGRHLPPFREAARRGAGAVMVGHILVPHLDPDLPATLSPRIAGGLLREGVGFEGVAIADDLEMGAITKRMPVGEAAVLAVLAGCDALLVCASRDLGDEAEEALDREAATSPSFRDLVERSAARARAFGASLIDPPPAFDPFGLRSPQHLAAAAALLGDGGC